MLLGFAAIAYSCNSATSKNNTENTTVVVDNTDYNKTNHRTKIQVAILLDTSSSMDGLIEQTKSRLWNIVNTLTTLKYRGENPQI